MARYAAGSKSIAICDRCGQRYPYTSLRKQWNGFRACVECWEPKHPQLDPIFPPGEPQALFEPRPDRKEPIDVPVGQNIFPSIARTSTQGVCMQGIVRVEIV